MHGGSFSTDFKSLNKNISPPYFKVTIPVNQALICSKFATQLSDIWNAFKFSCFKLTMQIKSYYIPTSMHPYVATIPNEFAVECPIASLYQQLPWQAWIHLQTILLLRHRTISFVSHTDFTTIKSPICNPTRTSKQRFSYSSKLLTPVSGRDLSWQHTTTSSSDFSFSATYYRYELLCIHLYNLLLLGSWNSGLRGWDGVEAVSIGSPIQNLLLLRLCAECLWMRLVKVYSWAGGGGKDRAHPLCTNE